MNGKSEGNWWEFYGIRYAQGTVVGAMIVYFLFSQNENLKKILFLPAEAKDFGLSHLILLAIYGLTYCYIASAPILVMHAGRGLLFRSKTNTRPQKDWFLRTLAILGLALPLPVYFLCTNGGSQLHAAGALFIYSALLAIQVVILSGIFYFRWAETIAYSTAVIKKREAATSAGYVESYRHLREHGNSFFIVVLQFLLATPIFIFVSKSGINSEDAIRSLCLIIFIWVLPAATIWAFGNKLENNLQAM
jgi:hypothetical protein